MMFPKHRLRVSILTQLIGLVLFVAMFSLLILAIVTGVYFTSVLTDTRVSKLEVVSELKSSQLQQSMDTYYFQALQLSGKPSVQQALTKRKAGNVSPSALSDAQTVMEQTIQASNYFSYANLYDLNFILVANASNPYSNYNASQSTLDSLFIFDQNTTSSGPSLPDGLLSNGAYLDGPILDDEAYFISLTVPVYSNESILVPQQFLSGYLTVIINFQSVNDSLLSAAQNAEYSSINYLLPIHPYNNLTNYTGFRHAFENSYLESFDITTTDVFNISKYLPAQDVFQKHEDLGNYVNIKNAAGQKVSLGYSSIDLGFALWLVTVEQVQPEFEGPITKLIKIMVGLCIGLAAFMCFITIPLAHYGVRPILKLQKATEEITNRRGLNRKRRRKHSTHLLNFLRPMYNHNNNSSNAENNTHNNDINEKDNKNQEYLSPPNLSPTGQSFSSSVRNSWNGSLNTPSSVDSFSNSYNTQESMDYQNTPLPSLVQTKGLFIDELTELTDAFNAMTLELDRQYTHLEDRVRARTKELEAAKVQADMARQQAEKANEAKTVFIANISHELRTPLNGILGMTSVAMSETDIDKIQNSLELIFRSGELLLHILIQLLTFSKNQLDKSKLQKKNFQVIEIVSQINSIFAKTAKDQEVDLVISIKPNFIRKIILYGDSNRLIQVVMNLVSNSLKFTPENGTVRVLIQLLGEYDEERSKAENYEKVYIKGSQYDTDHYPVKQINEEKSINDDSTDSGITNEKEGSDDNSSIISNRTTSTLSTLRSSLYAKALSDQYKSPNCHMEYFNEDRFSNDSNNSKFESVHKSRKCYNFGADNIDFEDLQENNQNDKNNNYNNEFKNWVIRFSVSDTGTGIEKSLQDKIFEAFVQGDQTLSRSHGGTGLGLSICKQFAKMMHGTLTLNSEVDVGSTFTFTIPLPQVGELIMSNDELEEYSKDIYNEKLNKKKKVTFDEQNEDTLSSDKNPSTSVIHNDVTMDLANSYKYTTSKSNTKSTLFTEPKNYDKPELITRASTGTAHSYKSRKSDSSSSDIAVVHDNIDPDLKLLVAEDNSVNQEVVKRMLKLEGINHIFMARDGKDAVEFVKECINNGSRPFDLILMDVQMPIMDGLLATRIIRNELSYQGPIVALTAFADVSNEKDCIDAGMSGFLSKPFSRPLLRKILKQFCSSSSGE